MRKQNRNKFYCDVGFRIKQIRSLNKQTQEFLGDHLGVSPQTIQRYESGEIPISTENVAKCAKVLHTPVGFFYGEDGQQPANTNTSRAGLMVASEVMALPDETIRKSVFHLVRAINRYDNEKYKTTD